MDKQIVLRTKKCVSLDSRNRYKTNTIFPILGHVVEYKIVEPEEKCVNRFNYM